MEEHRAKFLVPPLPLSSDRPVTGPSSHSEETKDVIHQDSAVLFMACYKINEKRVSLKWLRCPLLCHGQQQDHHKVLSERRRVIIMSYMIHHSHPAFFHSKKDRAGTAQLVQHLTENARVIWASLRCGKVFFPLHQFPVQTFLRCPYSPSVQL